jgi:hypothetical protein
MARVVHLALCGALGFSLPASAEVEWERIASRGDAAPGGGVFTGFGAPRVLGDGSVVIYGYRSGETQQRFYRWVPGEGLSLHHELRADEIPGEDPVVRLTIPFLPPPASDVGVSRAGPWMSITRRAEFVACDAADPSRPVPTIVDESGALEVVGLPGAPVPGLPGWIFSAPEYQPAPLEVNAHGDVAFGTRIRFGDLCGEDPLTAFSNAVFGPDGAGGVALIAQTRDPAPGFPPGAVILPEQPYAFGPPPAFQLNDAGEVVFEAITRTGPSGPDLPTVYRWDATQGLRPVVAVADSNQLGGAFPLGDFSPLLGPGGHVAFADSFRLPAALYVQDRDGVVEMRHAAGDPAPGVPGATFAVFGMDIWVILGRVGGSFAMNAAGHLAFIALVPEEGTIFGRGGVWAEDASGMPNLRLFDGEPLPDVPGLELGAPFQIFAMNDAHDVLIVATLQGPGIVPTFPQEVAFVLSRASGERVVFRAGQMAELEFGPGDVREAALSGFAFDERLTRVGALADGSVFTAKLPEPASAGAGAVALVALVFLARARRVRGRIAVCGVFASTCCAFVPSAQALEWEVVAATPWELSDFAWMPDGGLRFFVSDPSGAEPLFSFYEWRDSAGTQVFDVLAPTGAIVSGLEMRDRWRPLVAFRGAFATVNRDVVSTPCGGEQRGQFLVSPVGDVETVAEYGTPAPGFPPGWIWFEVRDSPAVSARGSLAFVGTLVQSGSLCASVPSDPIQRALFGPDGAGGLALVAVDEEQAPGNAPGAALLLGPVLEVNDAGYVLFRADVRLGPAGPIVPALYRWSFASGMQRIAQVYEPTLDGAASVSEIADTTLEADGAVVVVSSTVEGGVHSHLLRVDAANTANAIVRGDVAPGTDDRSFESFGSPVAGNAGGFVFAARVSPQQSGFNSDGGVWARDPAGSIDPVLLSGDPVPGLDEAVVSYVGAEPLAVTEAGALLLSVGVKEASNPYPTSNDMAFYIQRSPGSLELVFGKQQSIASRPESFRPLRMAYDDVSSRIALQAHGSSGLGGTAVLAVASLPEPGAVGTTVALLALTLLRLRA